MSEVKPVHWAIIALVLCWLNVNPAFCIGRLIPYQLDSGNVDNSLGETTIVFSEEIDLGSDVAWARVLFSEVTLSPRSVVRITSLLDGGQQTLGAKHLIQWGHGTAFFNGSRLRIEILAEPGGSNRVRIEEILVNEPLTVDKHSKSICLDDDDRVPNDPPDPAIARLLQGLPPKPPLIVPAVCTGFIVNYKESGNNCHISAGHCLDKSRPSRMTIAQFDTPALSNADCTLRHPDPKKQFAVDPASVRAAAPPHVLPNDWSVFQLFRNPTTGKTSYQEQGDAVMLASSIPGLQSAVTIVGYGADGNNAATGGGNSACTCDPAAATGQRNNIQQLHSESITGISPGYVEYTVDTCSGNSGSPILHLGEAIGIHTHGGCPASTNAGTRIDLQDLQDALVEVCEAIFASGFEDGGVWGCTPSSPPMAPAAQFEVTKLGLTVYVSDKSTECPTSWQWSMGDGTSASGMNPFPSGYTYPQAGNYTITLTVTNSAGSDSQSQQIDVEPLP